MKGKKLDFFVLTLVLIFAFLSTQTMAQSSCMNVIMSLSPCLDYITGNSSTPASGCCTQLASVVASQPQCLCQVINNSSSLGISINQTQALALPSACKVQTPPASRCNDLSPVGSPGESPGGGSKTVPSNGGDSHQIKMTFSVLFLFLSVVTYYASTGTII